MPIPVTMPGRRGLASVRLPGGELVELEEGAARVDEQVDALACRQLPARAMARHRRLAAAERHGGGTVAQLRHELLHAVATLLERRVVVDPARQRRHRAEPIAARGETSAAAGAQAGGALDAGRAAGVQVAVPVGEVAPAGIPRPRPRRPPSLRRWRSARTRGAGAARRRTAGSRRPTARPRAPERPTRGRSSCSPPHRGRSSRSCRVACPRPRNPPSLPDPIRVTRRSPVRGIRIPRTGHQPASRLPRWAVPPVPRKVRSGPRREGGALPGVRLRPHHRQYAPFPVALQASRATTWRGA